MNSQEFIEAIPLGGLGEFGMNMMVFRYGTQMIVVDSGLMFPDEELLGIDVIVPDISFLIDNASQVQAIVLTHGHEDHIGALPFVFPALSHVPIYGTRYTLGLASAKLAEHRLLDQAELVTVEAGQTHRMGDFQVEFIHVTHSIVDAVMLAISTPVGVILHTGDFKIDSSPLDGRVTDLPRIAEYGSQGVLALFSDSTNVDRPGFTPSETAVIEKLDEIFHHAPGKVIVSCFTSSIHRIQTVFNLAQRYGRKVAIAGRSMLSTTKIAHQLGYLNIPDGLLVKIQDARRMLPERVVLILTGCQGQPLAALPQMAVDNFKNMKIGPEDTVVISARIIPGNEKTISRMVNHLYKRGAAVHYDDGSQPPIHVSGHASAEELKLLLNLVRPKHFVPIHGEFRQLYRHAELARNLHAVGDKVLIAETGDRIQLSQQGAELNGKAPVGRIFIDEGSLDELEEVVVRDRRHLSEDGIVLPILAINKASGKMETQPEIITRGFVFVDEDDTLLEEARGRVLETLEDSSVEERTDWSLIKEKIRTDLRRFLFKQTAKRPLVLPVILEI